MVGRKTEKSRFKRGMVKIRTLMHEIMHYSIKDQVKRINQFLRGHFNYYGLGGNLQALSKIYRKAEGLWRKMLSRRSQKSYVTWEEFSRIKERFPFVRPSLKVPYERMKALAIL